MSARSFRENTARAMIKGIEGALVTGTGVRPNASSQDYDVRLLLDMPLPSCLECRTARPLA